MASSAELLDYILDRLSPLSGIKCRKMMGEYIIYHHGKIAAYLCDERPLVKILPCTPSLPPDASREPPYEGAKNMLLVDRVDDRDFLSELFETMYPELPAPKPKRTKN